MWGSHLSAGYAVLDPGAANSTVVALAGLHGAVGKRVPPNLFPLGEFDSVLLASVFLASALGSAVSSPSFPQAWSRLVAPPRAPARSPMMCSFRATTLAGGHRGRGNSRAASRFRRRIHGARGSPAHPGCCPGSSCRERGVQRSSAPPLPRQAPYRLQCPAPTLQQSIPVSFCILGSVRAEPGAWVCAGCSSPRNLHSRGVRPATRDERRACSARPA
jgi:hypothetical protein